MKGAPWDFKASSGDDFHDDDIPVGADARPPDPLVEIPSRRNVRTMYIRRVAVSKVAQKILTGTGPSCIVITNSDGAVERLMMQDSIGADRVVRS